MMTILTLCPLISLKFYLLRSLTMEIKTYLVPPEFLKERSGNARQKMGQRADFFQTRVLKREQNLNFTFLQCSQL